MVESYLTSFEHLVSKPRLDRYRMPHSDELDTLVNYFWNIALSESLIQGLAVLEVGFRNTVHNTLSAHVGTEYWFQAILRPDEMKIVTDAWTKLSRRHNRPPTPGQLIAELTFGFWPPLFASNYRDLWWSNKAALFRTAFPHIPTGLPPHHSVTPKTINERTDLCCKLRNRVTHHEPIFAGLTLLNVPPVPLGHIHSHITELLAWIDPNLSLGLGFVDRFPDVYLNEASRIRAKLKTHFGIP